MDLERVLLWIGSEVGVDMGIWASGLRRRIWVGFLFDCKQFHMLRAEFGDWGVGTGDQVGFSWWFFDLDFGVRASCG